MTQAIMERSNVSRAAFEQEILPAQQPVVLRGLVGDWPLVRAAAGDASRLYQALAERASNKAVSVMVAPSAAEGWLHYNPDLSGFNFERRELAFQDLLAYLLAHASKPGVAVAMQSVLASDLVPDFEADHRLELTDAAVQPRLWIGNAVTVAAHYDPSENIACVLAGRRRFTLYPPEQVANLYVGPLEITPAGASVSLVRDPPDHARFPRYARAQAAALTAELGPGDAIYIPYLWWHRVDSLEPLNLLANYWWGPDLPGGGAPRDAFIHALIGLRDLSKAHRTAWRALFDHYVFGAEDGDVAHIPEARRGMLGKTDAQARLSLRRQLARWLDPEL